MLWCVEHALCLINLDDAMVLTDAVVVADALGAGLGEDVVVAYGHAARVGYEEIASPNVKPAIPIDAAVVAIVDRFDCHGLPAEERPAPGSSEP